MAEAESMGVLHKAWTHSSFEEWYQFRPDTALCAARAHQAAPGTLAPGVASAGPHASNRGGAAARSSESAIARRNAGRCSTNAVTCPPGTHRSSLPGQWRACTMRHMLDAVYLHAAVPVLVTAPYIYCPAFALRDAQLRRGAAQHTSSRTLSWLTYASFGAATITAASGRCGLSPLDYSGGFAATRRMASVENEKWCLHVDGLPCMSAL
jgi:hypothetical protein